MMITMMTGRGKEKLVEKETTVQLSNTPRRFFHFAVVEFLSRGEAACPCPGMVDIYTYYNDNA
jgi:hypothetical protein